MVFACYYEDWYERKNWHERIEIKGFEEEGHSGLQEGNGGSDKQTLLPSDGGILGRTETQGLTAATQAFVITMNGPFRVKHPKTLRPSQM